MNNYYEYKYGERYGYRYMDYGGYSSGSSYNVDVESQTKKNYKKEKKWKLTFLKEP